MNLEYLRILHITLTTLSGLTMNAKDVSLHQCCFVYVRVSVSVVTHGWTTSLCQHKAVFICHPAAHWACLQKKTPPTRARSLKWAGWTRTPRRGRNTRNQHWHGLSLTRTITLALWEHRRGIFIQTKMTGSDVSHVSLL